MLNDVADLTDISRLWNLVSAFIVQYAFQIIGALFILLAGWWLSGMAGRAVSRAARRFHLDVTLAGFIAGAARIGVLALAIVAALNGFGITIAPLIAAAGAAAFGLTVAVQGTLGNLGAGAALIVTRPFKVGDLVTVKGIQGTVVEINLMSTVLTNDAGDRIIVPNRQISGEILTNAVSGRGVAITVPLPLKVAPDGAMAEIARAVAAVPGVAAQPPVKIGIDALTGDGVTLDLRYWIAVDADYQTVRHHANRALMATLEDLGVRARAGAPASGEA